MFVACFFGLTDSRPKPLRTSGHKSYMGWYSHGTFIRTDDKFNVAELACFKQLSKILVKGALQAKPHLMNKKHKLQMAKETNNSSYFWIAWKLKTNHLSRSNIVINSTSKDVPIDIV